jgi:3-dehydroquinate synthetase
MEPSALHKAVAWSASIKAQVVSEDEKEMGKRTILNYGHTVGHALEAATGYERFFHGEAVSIGMMADAEISVRLGLLSRRVLERQKLLLERFGLPTECSGVDVSDIIRTMELDKKVRNKAIRWVLLENVGKTVVRSDVPEDVVLSALAEVIRN